MLSIKPRVDIPEQGPYMFVCKHTRYVSTAILPTGHPLSHLRRCRFDNAVFQTEHRDIAEGLTKNDWYGKDFELMKQKEIAGERLMISEGYTGAAHYVHGYLETLHHMTLRKILKGLEYTTEQLAEYSKEELPDLIMPKWLKVEELKERFAGKTLEQLEADKDESWGNKNGS